MLSKSNSMNTTFPASSAASYTWLAPLASTLGIILCLFYIDEGYYDFHWMANVGNWVVFFIYFIIMLPVQVGISEFVFRRAVGRRKLLIMVGVSMPATILLLMVVFYFIGS